MLLNDDIVDIEKPDGICSLTFAVNELSVSSEGIKTLQKSLFSHTFL